jgi:hypothetical protein
VENLIEIQKSLVRFGFAEVVLLLEQMSVLILRKHFLNLLLLEKRNRKQKHLLRSSVYQWLTMKTKSIVSKFTKGRKHVEIPSIDRDEFQIGDKVYIERIRRKNKS